jgi:hypothetical protein
VSAPVLTVTAGGPDFCGRTFWEAVAAHGIDVEVVGMTVPDSRRERLRIAEHLVEVRVPMRHAHADLVERWLERDGTTEALALALHHRHTPEYGEELARSAARAAAVVAAGSFAAPALLRYTRAPLIVDARGVEPNLTPLSEQLATTAQRIECRACRAAVIVRACSARHAVALVARYELSARRVLTIPDGGPGVVQFVPFDVRRVRGATFGLDRHPILLALALARPHSRGVSAALDDLERELPGVRVIREARDAELPALLAVANAAIVLDDGPGARGDILMLSQAGVPLLAEAGPLEDARLRAGVHAIQVNASDGLGDAVRAALDADHTSRVLAAGAALRDCREEDAAAGFLADTRITSLLEWSRPMVRRPRPRAVSHSQ